MKANITLDAHEVGGWLSCARREAGRARGGRGVAAVPVAEVLRMHCLTGEKIAPGQRILYDEGIGDAAAMRRAATHMRTKWLDWLDRMQWDLDPLALAGSPIPLMVGLGFDEWKVAFQGGVDVVCRWRDGFGGEGNRSLVLLSCAREEPVGAWVRAAITAWLWQETESGHNVTHVARVWNPRGPYDEPVHYVDPIDGAAEAGAEFARQAGWDTMHRIARPGLHCRGCYQASCPAQVEKRR